jgi:hypothetical protein
LERPISCRMRRNQLLASSESSMTSMGSSSLWSQRWPSTACAIKRFSLSGNGASPSDTIPLWRSCPSSLR